MDCINSMVNNLPIRLVVQILSTAKTEFYLMKMKQK